MKKRILLYCLLSIFFTGCNNVEYANQKTKSSTKTGEHAFVSKVYEPQDKMFRRFQYYDFLEPRCHKFEQVNDTNYQEVHILEIRKTALQEFFDIESKLINLEALMIVYTQFDHDDFENLVDVLAKKKHFKKLILNHNGFKKIPANISKLKGLITLDLSFQDFPTLPDEITDLPKLSYLRVAKNKNLKSLPVSLGKLTNLEILEFGGTSMQELPKSIGNCINLKNLTGNACQLKAIPAEIGMLTEMRDINLGHNKIESIPNEMGLLTEMIGLYLGGNQLQEIPDELKALTKLEVCGFPINKLRVFPHSVLTAKNLRTLSLYDNEFTSVPKELIELKNLKILYLDVPKINNLDLKTIKDALPSLDIRNK